MYLWPLQTVHECIGMCACVCVYVITDTVREREREYHIARSCLPCRNSDDLDILKNNKCESGEHT